jgi:hypothetical protein
MPSKLEWQAAGAVLLFLLMCLPWNSLFDLLFKVRRTWGGKREESESIDRSVTR